jgi:hypothetical protein
MFILSNKNLFITLTSLIFLFFITLELSYQLGKHHRSDVNAGNKYWIGTIEIAIAGILGLLLAFTFSMAQSHFDLRKRLTIQETAAIGTVYLRAQLLPNPQRSSILKLLHEYVDMKTMANQGKNLEQSLIEQDMLLSQMWLQVSTIKSDKISPKIVALFINSLNKVIDIYSERFAVFNNRIPKLVLIVLLICGCMTIAVTGYNSGLRNKRNLIPTSMILILISLVFLVILDLDAPRHGFIKTNERVFVDLQKILESKTFLINKSL